jgi:hypothetical protein
VNESEIYGRGKEKEELVNILLANADDLPIYAMWGMGGLGKTTLAQLVYNEERVTQQFGVRIWVCVSVVLNSIHLEGQGRQPPAVTAQPPTGQPPAASHQLFAATAASRLHT